MNNAISFVTMSVMLKKVLRILRDYNIKLQQKYF